MTVLQGPRGATGAGSGPAWKQAVFLAPRRGMERSALTGQLPENLGVERRLLRHRPKTGTGEGLLAEKGRPLEPSFTGSEDGRLVIGCASGGRRCGRPVRGCARREARRKPKRKPPLFFSRENFITGGGCADGLRVELPCAAKRVLQSGKRNRFGEAHYAEILVFANLALCSSGSRRGVELAVRVVAGTANGQARARRV